jgi:hypothetical protein
MYGLVILAVLGQPVAKPAAGGIPPQQVLASIDTRGNLTITQVSSAPMGGYLGAPMMPMPPMPGPEKTPAKPKVKVTHLTVTMTEMPAKDVRAYTVEGREISTENLSTMLARERPVLVALDGKKVDPFYLRLYKEDTIVLVPPANTMGGGGWGGGFGGYGGYGGPGSVYVPVPTTVPPVGEPIKNVPVRRPVEKKEVDR